MKRSKKWAIILPTTILLIGSLAMIFPFVWMFLSSFKTQADIISYPPRWLPSEWVLDNFIRVFQMVPFLRYYANSLFTSAAQTILQIMIAILAAYSIAKLTFPGKRFVTIFIQSSMFVPPIVTTIPLFFLVSRLSLVDTYAGIIIPQIFSAFIIFLLVSFFISLPNSLMEAALIDGCSYFRILTTILVPNSKSAIATASLFSFLGHWRSYMWPLIVTNKTSIRTLPIGLKYLIQESTKDYEVMMAAALMTLIPVLIIYLIYEKELVKSVVLSGLK